MSINVDFDWYRAFSKDGSAGYEYSHGKIREIGREIEPIKPVADSWAALFLIFGGLDGSPKACVEFANDWGLIKVQQFERDHAEPLSLWRSEINSVKHWVAILRNKTARRGRSMTAIGTSTDVFLRFGSSPTPLVVLRPKSLIDFMRLQMAQFFSGGNELADCVECGNAFAVGVTKRVDSKFCTDACRFRYHNKRRAGK